MIYTGIAARLGWRHHYGNRPPRYVHGHDYLTYAAVLPLLGKETRKFFTVHDPLSYHQRMLGRVDRAAILKERVFHRIENTLYARSD